MHVMTAGAAAAPALAARALAAPALAARDHAAFRARLAGAAAPLYQRRDGPDYAHLSTVIDKLGRAFEAFKQANDDRLTELGRRGAADPVLTEKVDRLSAELATLSALKGDLDRATTRASRPGGAGEGGAALLPEAGAYRAAFLAWCRSPGDGERQAALRAAGRALDATRAARPDDLETRATQTVTNVAGAGGFALPEQIESQIARIGLDASPMRQIALVRTVGSPDYKELFDLNGATFEWVGETGTRAQTNTPDLVEVAPTFGLGSARPRASEESLDDLFFDVETWLVTSAGEAIGQGEGVAFISGNGTNRPTGFLAGPTPVATADATRAFGTLQYVPSLAAAALPTSPDVFLDMVYALRARYRANARWLTARPVLAALRKYKDTTGQYLWQPSLSQSQPESFMGYPVTEAEDMPAVAANSFPLAFGDFREGYMICDRVGMRMTRDDITLPGFVQFYIRRRVGGRLRNTQAIKLLKIATS
jgi:HK97 family phage major capsid protein